MQKENAAKLCGQLLTQTPVLDSYLGHLARLVVKS